MTTLTLDERLVRFNNYLNKSKLERKDYQCDGVRWILNNELRDDPVCGVRGGFIADEMGLGKTIMMIGTFLCNFLPRTLIIVPPVLLDQWWVQIYRTTGHRALIYHGENKKTITEEALNSAKIVISTYGAITLTQKQIKEQKVTSLHRVKWSRIVFDEAHHLRNSKTSLYKGAKMLSAKIRWLVSGTPIQNSKNDFYSLCSMIRLPASFYTESENLRVIARSFILKRTKKQVGILMTDVVVDKNMVEWGNTKEMKLAEQIHSACTFSRVLPTIMSNPIIDSMKARGTLGMILRAKQSCIYPKLLSNNSKIQKLLVKYPSYNEAFDSSSKIDFAVNKILERKGNGAGKLIFCHFREEIDQIATRLRAGGIEKVATFDGRTCSGKRYEILNGGYEVLILQIQTGCEGLNLQENYSEIYFISPHWNPAIEDQAIARCHRIGQTKPVYVERFEMCAFETEEEQILPTRTIDNYVENVQECKRLIANEFM